MHRTLLLLLAVLAGVACNTRTSQGAAAAPPIESAVDAAQLNDVARFLAGIPGRPESPLHALESEASWIAWAENFKQTWAEALRTQFEPVAVFQRTQVSPGAATVFYPFSGPDVLYMLRFFPAASVYVMAGLEGAGDPPLPAVFSRQTLPAELDSWRKALYDVFHRSFFVTSAMAQSFRRGARSSGGLAPAILLLLARDGYTIDSIRFGEFSATGDFEPLPAGAAHHVIEVRFHAGNNAVKTLYYSSGDLGGFVGTQTLGAFLHQRGEFATLIKSASYVPHRPEFAPFRDLVLANTSLILQDDTGIPWHLLEPKTWDVTLYGEYSVPDPPFRGYYQTDMAAAFKARSGPRPLGFSIGYGYNRRTSSMMLARRRSK